MPPLHIVSWNVAGWATTVNRINEHYQPPSISSDKNASNGKSRKLHPAAALQHFFQLHQATIVCLQEHKIPTTQLKNRAEPCQASSIPGYESFWSCCVDEQNKGFNGVVTYAPVGSVLSANAAPLGSPDLDKKGRCIMTDHGDFVIFNVYAPASGGHPLSFKMKFLRALRRAMQAQRAKNKKVILLGDLNISHRAKDIHWASRRIQVRDILRQVQESKQEDDVPQWKLDVFQHWPTIKQIMETQRVIESKTTNSLTNDTFDKFRLVVTVENRTVHLGSNEKDPEYCRHGYNLDAQSYVDEELNEDIPYHEAESMCVGILAELMNKLTPVTWDLDLQRQIAASSDATEPRLSPTRAWFSKLLSEDKMVDTFRHFFPEAEGRFTCWHQFTNKRYTNEGSRIDYVLIDEALLPLLQKGTDLRCGCVPPPDEDPCSEEAALRAATANGRFQPVSFVGGGIQSVSQRTMDSQFGEPHTGMIYTPPSFSDHIGVSVLLENSEEEGLLKRDLTLSGDKATVAAMPHKKQKTLSSFFAPAAAGTGTSKKRALSSNAFAKATKKPTKPKKSSIAYHFQKRSS